MLSLVDFKKSSNFASALPVCWVSKAKNASVAELVDALDSKSCTFGCAGSIPARGTTKKNNPLVLNRLGDFSFIIIRQSIRIICFI